MPQLHIQLRLLQPYKPQQATTSYFSLLHQDQHYFSSSFSFSSKASSQDDFIINLKKGQALPQSLMLQRWENHMVLFFHNVDIAQLKGGRSVTKKKWETRTGQLIQLITRVYDDSALMFNDRYIPEIGQHYLLIEDIHFINEKTTARICNSPTYFAITTNTNQQFIIPVRNSCVIVKIPDSFSFSSYRNNDFNGKSKMIASNELSNQLEIDLLKGGASTGKIRFSLKWVINLHKFQVEKALLMDSNEVFIYDIQVKFDNPVQLSNCKLKIIYGTKAFQFPQELNGNKITKIKKMLYFIIKSDSQDIDIIIEKSMKVFSKIRVSSSEIKPYSSNTLKKKFIAANKEIGYIRFKAEKAKNLSLPQNNKRWRQTLKKKVNSPNQITISFQQLSVYFRDQEPLTFIAKTDSQEKRIQSICNLNYFSQQDEIFHQSVEVSVKNEESIYLLIKPDSRNAENDFYGIASLSVSDLRLGICPSQISFFKNQQKTATINCLINKMPVIQFLKPNYQPQLSSFQGQSLQIDLFINKIELTPYYYTYQYQNKNELYCITEVNKIKKVLILESTAHNDLSFLSTAGSDNLDFAIEENESIRIKVTFLASDLGQEEEIYGTALVKLKTEDIMLKALQLKKIDITNDYGVIVGTLNIEIAKGSPIIKEKAPQSPIKISPAKKKAEVFDLSQASFDTNAKSIQISRIPNRRYSGNAGNANSKLKSMEIGRKSHHLMSPRASQIKLPMIKQSKKDNFKDLFQMMKVRKRGVGGHYEQNQGPEKIEEIQPYRKERHSFDLNKIQKNNPNLPRNLQILFPKKPAQKGKNERSYLQRKNEYEEKLRGLKSVMKQISQDIGQIEPTIREQTHQNYEEPIQNEAEWANNEFALPNDNK